MKVTPAACAAAILAAVVVAGCGGDDGGGDSAKAAGGGSLTVYSSLPLQGASKNQAQAIRNGMKLALKQANGRVGDYKIKYTSLDDSTAQAGAWTPEATSANARKAAQDDSTIAYLGEFNSGASAVSIPILNEAGVPQNGLTNTAVGLTTDAAGSEPGRAGQVLPDRRAQLRAHRAQGRHPGRRAGHDDEAGRLLEGLHAQRQGGLRGRPGARTSNSPPRSRASTSSPTRASTRTPPTTARWLPSAKGKGADCMVYAGITANNAVQLFKDFSAAMPDGKLYGPDGIAESGFSDPKEGGIPADVGSKVKVAIAALPPDEYGPEGQKFFKDYAAEYGDKSPDPVRDLRLRVDEPDARRDQARRRRRARSTSKP